MEQRKRKYALELPIQYFAEGGEGGNEGGNGNESGAGSQGSGQEGNTGKDTTGGQGGTPTFTPEQQAQIDRMLQSAQDAIRNQHGQEMKNLKLTVEQLQNAGKTKEQIAQDAANKLLEGQQELLKSKNEFHAIRKLADEKLGGDLLEFVVVNEGDNEEARNGVTDSRIKKLKDLIDAEVKAQVEAKFKDAGYNPGRETGEQPYKPSSMRDLAAKHRIIK